MASLLQDLICSSDTTTLNQLFEALVQVSLNLRLLFVVDGSITYFSLEKYFNLDQTAVLVVSIRMLVHIETGLESGLPSS